MNVRPVAESLSAQLEDELTNAVIVNCRLTQEQVGRIREAMNSRNLSFIDAALFLDLITANEAAEALDWAQHTVSRRESSLVETAIRRQNAKGMTTVRHTVHVKPSTDLLLLSNPDHPHSERIRALRTELLLLLPDNARQASTVALLSPGPGEGRSQLVAELAIAFSQLGRRTLLVDADLRRPQQHILFKADNNWGIAQALAFNEPPPLLGVEGLPHLSLLLSGPIPPNPLELLSGGRFEQLLSDWRRQYDFIAIDTPAVTKYADGLAIAAFAEQVLLASRANVTALTDMKESLRRLSSTRARILGAVINDF